MLAARLVGAGVSVLLTVGDADEDVERALQSADARVRGIAVFRERLTVLSALLARAALVVGNTTGPIHLAAARGTPTLALHAPWPTCGVSRWGPYSQRGWAIVADAPGARDWSHRQRRHMAEPLMRGVPPELVLDVAQALLEGRHPDVKPK